MREDIQSLLNELTTIETGAEVPDDVLEDNKTYFSFSLNENQIESDFNNKFTYEVNITGYVKRLVNQAENTLDIVDTATKDIISKLKELNIRCSYQDISIQNGVQKTRIIGRGSYNEINNVLM